MFIDSHAHIDLCKIHPDEVFINDLSSVVHISLNVDEFLEVYPLYSKNPNILFATGYYPSHSLVFNPDSDMPKLKEVLTQYPHCALGEIGIDLLKTHYGSLSEQTLLFESQLALAEELNLPVVIHSRESFDECYNSLKKYNVTPIIHCFSYGVEEANKILELGGYVSFSGILTFPKNPYIQEAAKIVPLDRILFETDSPYLAPIPLRGKPNFPCHVRYTYDFFAKLRQIPIEELCSIAQQNFNRVFNL